MFIVFNERPSDSPFVERVWNSHSERAGTFHSVAACHWELVISRYEGTTFVTVRGPETKATSAECPAEGEWLGIRFKLGTFMPILRPGILRDRNDQNLPIATSRSFWLGGSRWDYPDYENAESFVKRLVNAGMISMDYSVRRALDDDSEGTSTRTVQRHFQRATGVTLSTVRQIQRARMAAMLLQSGSSILDTVDRAGYYDQPHLTRSLRRLIGQTPEQVRRADAQLSFLYKTDTL